MRPRRLAEAATPGDEHPPPWAPPSASKGTPRTRHPPREDGLCVSSSATHPPAETATPREVCHLTYRIMIMYQKFAYYLASLFFFVWVPGFGFGFVFERRPGGQNEAEKFI